ncbi:hypothetical protein MSPP1_004104 [Malassezia sp. CBS 17886]|nr:hypothetical protein MSPP1_004104 [Malassezia sp. CBS 17886]
MYVSSIVRWLALATAALPAVSALGLVPYPSQDPFYHPPGGWQNKGPGDILRSRKIQAASVGILKFNLDAYQYLYRSNGNSAHDPSYTVTTVLVPHNAKRDTLVTISSPENSNAANCAPSYAFRHTGILELTNFEPRWEQMIYTLFLAEGWIVNSPDHEGPASAFADGILMGHMVLDSMRATLNAKEVKMDKGAKLIGHGYSGGALANGWAAGLQKSYAPELNIVGWVLGGTPADMRMTLDYLDGGATAALVLAGAVGLIDGFRDELYDMFQNEIWTDEGKRAVAVAHNSCIYALVAQFVNQRIQSDKYIKGGKNLTEFPAVSKILTRLTMGRNPKYTPKQPLFMFHSAYDEEIVWYQANRTAVEWCNSGANLRFLTYTVETMNHVWTYLVNVPYIIMFMRDRFQGKDYYGGGCQFDSSNTDPVVDVNILGERYREALEAISDLLGKEIGPKDSILMGKIKDGKNPNKDGVTRIPGMQSTDLTPGEGGNDSKKSKTVQRVWKGNGHSSNNSSASDNSSSSSSGAGSSSSSSDANSSGSGKSAKSRHAHNSAKSRHAHKSGGRSSHGSAGSGSSASAQKSSSA